MGTRLKIKKTAQSLWTGNMTLNHDISRTSWRMKVSDGSFFWIFDALLFESNLYGTKSSPLRQCFIRRNFNLKIKFFDACSVLDLRRISKFSSLVVEY